MSRRFRSMALLLVCAGALMTTAVAFAHAPAARVARSCNVGMGYGYGYTYLTSLNVTHTSCSNGKYIAGRHGHVGGWQCNKTRQATSPLQYQDRETCNSGRRRVVWTFSQNTY